MPDPKLKTKKKLTMAQKTNGAMSPATRLKNLTTVKKVVKKPTGPPVKNKKKIVKKPVTDAQIAALKKWKLKTNAKTGKVTQKVGGKKISLKKMTTIKKIKKY